MTFRLCYAIILLLRVHAQMKGYHIATTSTAPDVPYSNSHAYHPHIEICSPLLLLGAGSRFSLLPDVLSVSDQMPRQQKVRNPLLHRILVLTRPTHQFALLYTRLQQYPV
jgi:hypothetical protein